MSEPHRTGHGDRGPRAHSCMSNVWGVHFVVLLLVGAENLGVTRPPEIKTPNSRTP